MLAFNILPLLSVLFVSVFVSAEDFGADTAKLSDFEKTRPLIEDDGVEIAPEPDFHALKPAPSIVRIVASDPNSYQLDFRRKQLVSGDELDADPHVLGYHSSPHLFKTPLVTPQTPLPPLRNISWFEDEDALGTDPARTGFHASALLFNEQPIDPDKPLTSFKKIQWVGDLDKLGTALDSRLPDAAKSSGRPSRSVEHKREDKSYCGQGWDKKQKAQLVALHKAAQKAILNPLREREAVDVVHRWAEWADAKFGENENVGQSDAERLLEYTVDRRNGAIEATDDLVRGEAYILLGRTPFQA